ncbi:MAG: histidine kinase [Bacilli bacterium]|jgi:sensor histidine kinase YesM|nr:histidine kinase [Bacilli bacterium]
MAIFKKNKSDSKSFKQLLTSQMLGVSSVVLLLITAIFLSTYLVTSNRIIDSKIETTRNNFKKDFNRDYGEYSSLVYDISKDESFLSLYDGKTNYEVAYSYLYSLNNKIRLNFSMLIYKGEDLVFSSSHDAVSALEHSYLMNAERKMEESSEDLPSYPESYLVERGNITSIGSKLRANSYLFLSFDNSDLSSYFATSTSEGYVLFDRKRNVLSTNESRLIGNVNEYNFYGESNLTLNGVRYKTDTSEFHPDYYLVVMALDIQPVEIWAMCITAGLMIIFFGTLVGVFSKKIAEKDAESLQSIVDGINIVISGDSAYRFPKLNDQEFDKISMSLNTMLDENDRLSKEKEELIVSKVESEMAALEAELNPHFLFNTLETIKYAIYIDKNMAVDLIYRMNKILRYSIDEKERNVRLKTEIIYLKYYLEICHVRFGEKFSYHLNLPEAAEDFVVPKLFLQPLVENSVKHNFNTKDSLEVAVDVNLIPDGFQIIVKDDGDGMSEEKLEEVQENLASKKRSGHLGIFSSYNLLKLYYHENVNFTIESELGKGTTITINIKEQPKCIKS